MIQKRKWRSTLITEDNYSSVDLITLDVGIYGWRRQIADVLFWNFTK